MRLPRTLAPPRQPARRRDLPLPPATSSCATPGRSWSSSSDSPRLAPQRGERAVMGLRLIQGGRASDGLPGLLIERAAEVATMAGGLRLGVRMDDPALLVAPGGDPGHEA